MRTCYYLISRVILADDLVVPAFPLIDAISISKHNIIISSLDEA